MGEPTAMLLPTYVAPEYERWEDWRSCCWLDELFDREDGEVAGCPLCHEGEAIELAIAEFAKQNNIERGEEDE